MEEIKVLLVKYIAGSADGGEIARVEAWLAADGRHMQEYLALEKAWRDAHLAGDPALLDADRAFGRLRSRLTEWPEREELGVGIDADSEGVPMGVDTDGVRRPMGADVDEMGRPMGVDVDGMGIDADEKRRPIGADLEAPVVPMRGRGKKWRGLRVAAVLGGALLLGAGMLYWAQSRRDASRLAGQQAERIVVPNGQKKHVFLPDSTELWLNAGTVLRIEPGYGVSHRQVWLEGEAYFKVKHDAKLVFTVTTPFYTVRDIGTAFNLHSYPGDSRFEAAVVEGEISVEGQFSTNNTPSRIVLSHNQVLKIRKEAFAQALASTTDTVVHAIRDTAIVSLTQSAAVSRFAGWKEDELVYDDENLRDIANGLERKFNVVIRIDDARLGDYHFTGSFKGLPDVASVLDILKETTPLIYEIRHDTVIMKSRR